ncbi:hypothetical protein FRB97_005769 [Tulasnella sp. 331]|nr:hypothetical protein FRB97_005769 [Tulasnella sp. 331]
MRAGASDDLAAKKSGTGPPSSVGKQSPIAQIDHPLANSTIPDHPVRVVPYFDELYDLTNEMVRAKPSSLQETAYTVFCRSLDVYHAEDIFHISLSTSSNLSTFSPEKVTA